MKSVLREIVEHKRQELSARERSCPLKDFENSIKPGSHLFLQAFKNRQSHAANIIAEVKPKSPSMGATGKPLDLEQVIATYNQHASAISVLTDEKYFGGNIELLRQVKALTNLPVLCKDFIISTYQILEARAAEADAVLLIVKALDDETLSKLYKLCSLHGMTAVVEVQNEEEIERALKIKPELLLVNNRNLDTLDTDLATCEKLMPIIPDSIVKVAASGIERAEDIKRLLPYCRNFLIGSSLMKSDNPQAKLKEFAEVR